MVDLPRLRPAEPARVLTAEPPTPSRQGETTMHENKYETFRQAAPGYAATLAAHLGPEWTVVQPEGSNPLLRREEDGLTLLLHQDGYGSGRARVALHLSAEESSHAHSALWPRVVYPDTSFDPARLERQPQAVANQVRRNVVSAAAEQYDRVKTSMAATATYEEAQDEVLAAMGLEPETEYSTKKVQHGRARIRVGEVFGDVQATRDKVHMDLSGLTVEQAVAIMAVLRG